MSRQQKLQHTLESLRSALPDLKGALIASTDGLAMAHALNKGDADRMAAMAATALGLGKRIADTIDAGALTETSVSGKDGSVYLYSADGKAVLAVMTNGTANLGLIHMESRDAARQIASIL